LKLYFKDNFQNKILIPFINKFASISNKILIDYKGFIKWIKTESLRIA